MHHPLSNCIIERFHRQLKDSLRARLASSDRPSHLPWVLLGLRSAPKEDHNVSSRELLYGVPLALQGELLDTAEPPATVFMENLRWPPPAGLPTRPLPPASSSSGPLQRLMEAEYFSSGGEQRGHPCRSCMTAHTRWRPGPGPGPIYNVSCYIIYLIFIHWHRHCFTSEAVSEYEDDLLQKRWLFFLYFWAVTAVEILCCVLFANRAPSD